MSEKITLSEFKDKFIVSVKEQMDAGDISIQVKVDYPEKTVYKKAYELLDSINALEVIKEEYKDFSGAELELEGNTIIIIEKKEGKG